MISLINPIIGCFCFLFLFLPCVAVAGEPEEEVDVGAPACAADCICDSCQEQEDEDFYAMVEMFRDHVALGFTPEGIAGALLIKVALGLEIIDYEELSPDALDAVLHMRMYGVRGASASGSRSAVAGQRKTAFHRSYR